MKPSRSNARSDHFTKASLPIVIDALASDLRRALLVTLANEPTIVSDLAGRHRVEISQISHNLKRLKDAGLVTATKKSRFRIYELAPCVQIKKRGQWLDLAVQIKDQQLVELRIKASQATRRRKRRP